MNHKFLQQLTDFIFVEDLPEKADIIFIPGSGFPQLGEEAAGLYHRDYASCILPSGRYSILTGHFGGVQEKAEIYDGEYDRMGISKGSPGKEPGAGKCHSQRGSGYLYL